MVKIEWKGEGVKDRIELAQAEAYEVKWDEKRYIFFVGYSSIIRIDDDGDIDYGDLSYFNNKSTQNLEIIRNITNKIKITVEE